MDEETIVTPETENQDSDTSVDTDENDTSESSNDSDSKYENQKKRAEKAEADAKEAKAKLEELESKVQTLTKTEESKSEKSDEPLTRDETILIAKGFDDAALQEAKDIARGKDIPLSEAIETEAFQAWKEKKDAEQADQAAQLGASTGSAPHVEETFKSGMTEDEHKAMWAKSMNN